MYRLIEQRLLSKHYLLDKYGDRVEDASGNEIIVRKNDSLDNVFYIVENTDDEDDEMVFRELDDALEYAKKHNIDLE